MPQSKRFRHVLGAAVLLVSMLVQGTWALAGTTGGLSGTVVDTETNAPISGVAVTVSSPSQTASTVTDAAGHFNFLSLTPDTYVVGASKDGYDQASVAGITIFADTVQSVAVTLHKTLKTIANVRSNTASNLVKSGTTADVYSVNAATQEKISALGGGGNLNSAYSAVASVPGAVMPLNQAGYFQTVHIRGGDYDQVGYEFDGVPVNRSFDNYPSGQLSSLGMSELQVYTGATPANSEGQGLAGYINQVIKSGTYPGFGQIGLGVGSPAFYHKFSAEAGGASPNRMFSYYAGVGGYNQDFRYVNQQNGGIYSDPYSGYGSVVVGLVPLDSSGNACTVASSINYTECYANGVAGPGGFVLGGINWIQPSSIADRDLVMNFHFGLPHRNDSGRDDVQLLWDSGMLLNGFYESVNDAPTYNGVNVFDPNFSVLNPNVATDDPGPITYIDGYQWTGPVGTAVPANPSQYVQPYLYPASPPHQANSLAVDPNKRDTIWNDQEIVKLQYQKNFGSNAYARLYGYTYYSDWLQTGPVCSYLNYNCITSPDYELSSHTRGVSLQFADQLSQAHLLTLQGNYTTARSTRDNNTQMFNSGGSRSLGAILVSSANPTSGLCYNASNTSTPVACNRSDASYLKWSCLGDPTCAPPDIAAASALSCGGAPCEYLMAESSLYATYNTVVPKFSSVSLADQWRPSSRWLFNVGVRADRFEFDGSSTNPNDPARQFWFNAYNLDHCVNAQGFVTSVDTLGVTPGACPSGYTQANLINASGQVLSYTKVQPRLSGTYTASPDTVFRFSGGEYVEPPSTAYEQYNTLQEDLADFLGSHFYNFGFNTPGHAVRPPVSYNYDLSWEQRLRGTDVSFKLTPFYRKTKDQIQNFFLDQATGFVSGLNVGRQTSEGVEFQLQKGDFTQNGLAGLLSLTYTHSYINYDKLQNGTTIVSQINNDIQTYNGYTSFCASNPSDPRCGTTTTGVAASPCYDTTGAPAACSSATVANPYWNAPVQSLLNPNADYATYDIFPGGIGGSADSFAIPYDATLVLNYKHDKFAITPSVQFLAGNRYGSPETTPGIDPAAGCGFLAGSASSDPRYQYGAPGGAPYDAMSCPSTITIPNPYSKTFDQPGAFVNPNQLLVNLQMSYDVSPKVSLIATFANLLNRCWGGSKEPWTKNDSNICSYGINNSAGIIQPVGNVYNPGATIQPFVQYPYEPYLGPVNVDGFSTKMPFNFYLEARIKI